MHKNKGEVLQIDHTLVVFHSTNLPCFFCWNMSLHLVMLRFLDPTKKNANVIHFEYENKKILSDK